MTALPASTDPIEAVRNKIRASLSYPKGARQVDEATGELTYVKPPHSYPTNLQKILGHDPAFYSHLGHNLLTDMITWDGKPLTDSLEVTINLQVETFYNFHTPTAKLHEMVDLVARSHPYHPIREWLDALAWDGVSRIDTLLSRYAGAADTPLHRSISRRFLLGAIARIYDPGCQLDTTLILVGAQGAMKSSFFRSLCKDPEWFCDTALDLHSKDAFQALQGVWLYEVAELAALRGRDAEATKAFLTSRADRYRPPYGRNIIRTMRQCVFVGTTNEAEFLDDPTGARRFWPVTIGTIDIDALRADRDQLWAEVVELRKTGKGDLAWHLDSAEVADLTGAQKQYQRADPWQDEVAEWLAGQMAPVTVREALTDALHIEARDQTKAAVMRCAGILAACGLVKRRQQVKGEQVWRWSRPDSTS